MSLNNLEQMKLSGFEPDPELEWENIADMAPPRGADTDITYRRAYSPRIVAIDKRRVLVIDHVCRFDDIHESLVRSINVRTRVERPRSMAEPESSAFWI